jgi:radical SAM superfamily enzyme
LLCARRHSEANQGGCQYCEAKKLAAPETSRAREEMIQRFTHV